MITRINQAFDCDAFFPALDPMLWQETTREDHRSETSGLDYAFVTYERR
ncbi:dihydrofolate reductase [Salmonella enterica]